MQFGCLHAMSFDKLDRNEERIRKAVFVEEQGFQNEIDELDDKGKAVHMVLFCDDEAIGTCRYYKKNEEYKLGRIAVIKKYRGKGYGAALVKFAEEKIYEEGGREVVLSAQIRSKEFYVKIGYVAEGEEYMEEMCPHIKMRKKLIKEEN